MPKWGLTPRMLEADPWGFDHELELLAPGKVFTDPVHGDIYLNKLELLVVNSRPFQRLRRVRQLGMTPEVYPGATNTRFSHSLGTLRAAQDLLDIVLDQRNDPHGVRDDLFSEWQSAAATEKEYLKQVGEVVIAARLGALLHDLAHVPFGHSIEDDLGSLPAHDEGPERFDHLWAELGRHLRKRLEDEEFAAVETLVSGELAKELRPLILSKEVDEATGKPIKAHELMQYPFVADLVGNTICADLIDYLPRDHLYSGLPMALGHRFLDAFFVTGTERTRLARRMALNIMREDRERTDTITELLKYLRYRYELTERALVHHAKLAADAMVGKALELWFDEVHDEVAAELAAAPEDAKAEAEAEPEAGATPKDGGAAGAEEEEAEEKEEEQEPGGVALIRAMRERLERQSEAAAEAGPSDGAGEVSAELGPLDDTPGDTAEERKQKRVQRRILLHGDDGLLEHLRDWAADRFDNPPATASADRLKALAHLVDGLLHRDLFRLAGRSSTQQASAEAIYKAYRKAEQRRELEENAAKFAGVDEPWKVCIWLPPPAPRLKSAEVLVFDGSEVVEFNRSEQYASKRGEDIYTAHERLWAVSVYIHRSVGRTQRQRAVVRLAQLMEVRWDREAQDLGPQVLEWPDLLAARDVFDNHRQPRREGDLVSFAREQQVARGPDDVDTYEALVARYEEVFPGLPPKLNGAE